MIVRETCQVDSLENYAMAAKPSIDPAQMLHDQLASASPDLLRSLLTTFLDALMSAPLLKWPCFHDHPAVAGQLDDGHLRQVLPAEQHAPRSGAEMAAAPSSQQLLR